MNADQIEFRKQFNALSHHRRLALERSPLASFALSKTRSRRLTLQLMTRWSSLKERNMNNLILHALTTE